MIEQFVCGDADGPIPGQTVFTHSCLRDALVDYIIVNNSPENQLEPTPGFSHNYIKGELNRSPNVWALSDKLIIHLRECNCS